MIAKIPINVDELEKQELSTFNPITVLPDSNKSISIVLSEVLYRSKMDFHPLNSYYIEIYYQKEPKSKWYFIGKFFLYNKGQLEAGLKKYVLFTVLNYDSTREKLKKSVRHQKTNLYQGASQNFLILKFRSYFYKLIKFPFYRVKDSFYSIPFYSHFLIDKVIDNLIKIPIIKKYGKIIDKSSIKFGAPESKPITYDAFEKIYSLLQKIAIQINSKAKKELEIKVEKKEGQIILTRLRFALKFYIAGDETIVVQEAYSSVGSRITYQIALRRKLWNKNFWYLDNYGFITIKSFVIRVIDAFIINSNY